MTVFAKDHGIPAKMGDVPVAIYVDNSNKYTPSFNQFSYYVNVQEDLRLNEPITRFTATDKDEGSAGEVWYKVSRGNEDNKFAIDLSLGIVVLINPLDYEKKEYYEIEITASDRSESPKSATAILHVTVTDVNDNAPVFQSLPAEVYSAQVIQANQLVYTFQGY